MLLGGLKGHCLPLGGRFYMFHVADFLFPDEHCLSNSIKLNVLVGFISQKPNMYKKAQKNMEFTKQPTAFCFFPLTFCYKTSLFLFESPETIFQAPNRRLVDAAKLQLRPSLWNLWAFVDVLYWQLKEALLKTVVF